MAKNRAAARAYAAEKAREYREEQQRRAAINADLKQLDATRRYLILHAALDRETRNRLINAIGNYPSRADSITLF